MEHDSTAPDPASQPEAAQTGGSLKRKGIDRRTLLRAGAGAAPVLLTMHSAPVSATTACTVASSFVSAATFASRSPNSTYIKCSYKNAGHWRSSAQSSCPGSQPTVPPYWWGNPQWPTWGTKKIKEHLCVTGSSYDDWYVATVLKTGSSLAASGELAILQHLLGLTLTLEYDTANIITAGAPGGEMSKPYLVGVWQTFKSTGRYTIPTDMVDWDATELLSWLKMLQYDIPVA